MNHLLIHAGAGPHAYKLDPELTQDTGLSTLRDGLAVTVWTAAAARQLQDLFGRLAVDLEGDELRAAQAAGRQMPPHPASESSPAMLADNTVLAEFVATRMNRLAGATLPHGELIHALTKAYVGSGLERPVGNELLEQLKGFGLRCISKAGAKLWLDVTLHPYSEAEPA